MTEPMVDLMVPTLRELSARRSEKWALYEPDVLSLTIAEMDFPIFAPIRDALVATIGRGDLGYAVATPGTLSAALTRFAQRRLNWRIDPEQVTVIPDVMLGLVELCRMLAAPGEAVGSATPAYPPFFRELSTAGLRRVEVPLRSDGLRAFVLANPHKPDRPGSSAPRA